ncbi:reverse transcriptase domain-containing protein [Rossellomorea vietnamensis]|uniref:reverse transcriptase domain-containing protein n=1 Tax=Rossellomorea vietnamensis TaxID=218284 RepID=UPI00398462AB|nr:hypothetical protein [Rossellomorea vietnamensis]
MLQQGYVHVVDADLQSYFNTIPHDKLLLARLQMRIKDGSVLGLISESLISGVMEKQVYKETIESTPQGGVLSPLLSNIYLHQFDLLMEEIGKRTRTKNTSNKIQNCSLYKRSLHLPGCEFYRDIRRGDPKSSGNLRIRSKGNLGRIRPSKKKFL